MPYWLILSGIYSLSLLVGMMASSAQGAASSSTRGIEGYNPTFYLDIMGGFTTHKSELVLQNDTSTHITYTLGGNAGAEREYGFFVKTDSNTTTFALNESSIQSDWRDTGIRYRMNFFYLGVVFTQLDMLANNAGTDQLDAGGTGIGGNVGVNIPIARAGCFYLDITSVSIATSRNALDQEVTFGTRQDIDLGAALDIDRRSFDFLLGYRMRTFSLTAGDAATETITTTYLGVRWAAFF